MTQPYEEDAAMADADDLAAGLRLAEAALVAYLEQIASADPDELGDDTSIRDAQEAYEDLWRLSADGDARYDLKRSGDLYAAWYQLARVVHAVGVLRRTLGQRTDDLDILDIGCGTGATAWAIAILERVRVAAGGRARRVRVLGVDGSPAMVRTARGLWERLSALIDVSGIDVDFLVSSWRNVTLQSFGDGSSTPIVIGGYVFDRSDGDAVMELSDDLRTFIESHGVESVILFGAAAKHSTVMRVLDAISTNSDGSSHWVVDGGRMSRGFVPREAPAAAETARRGFLDAIGVRSRDRSEVSWGYESESSFGMLRRSGQGGLRLGSRPRIVLDPAQRVAASPDGRPTLILGAAGSGKSEVLVHRLVATVEGIVRGRLRPHRAGRQRVLVTAQNKYMVDHLVRRVEQELSELPDPLEISYAACPRPCLRCAHEPKEKRAVDCWLRVGSDINGATIRFLNWDKVFTKVLDVPPKDSGYGTDSFLHYATPEDRLLLAGRGIDDGYLAAEFRRIVYGLRVRDEAEYLDIDRRGRATERLVKRSDIRGAVWRTIDARGLRSARRDFTNVRYDALVRDPRVSEHEKYDHIFVDEGQDFSDADFEILSRIAAAPDGVVVALDPTQSQYLGASFRLPTRLELEDASGSRRNWNRHSLARTHRLSISISRAIRPLAESIASERDDIVALDPRKSAIIGARPIVVDAISEVDIGRVAMVLLDQAGYLGVDPVRTSRSDGRRMLLLAGKHDWYRRLDQELRRWSDAPEIGEILASGRDRSDYWFGDWKGLEFDGVVWLTGATLGRPEQTIESTAEWVYTILSRARSLLIIVLTPDTDPEVRRLVGLLDAEHLRFWEESAAAMFEGWRRPAAKASSRT